MWAYIVASWPKVKSFDQKSIFCLFGKYTNIGYCIVGREKRMESENWKTRHK